MDPKVPTSAAEGEQELVTRIFTFGYGQHCPFTTQELIGYYVTVVAPEAGLCRQVMFRTFGREWAYEYDSPERAGVERFGLIEYARLVVGVKPTDPTGLGFSREADDPTPVSPAGVQRHPGGVVEGGQLVDESEAEPVTVYFSFGHGQRDPNTNEHLLDKYVTITGPSYEACREAMFASRYGNRWSFDYTAGTELANRWIPQWTEHDRIDATGQPDTQTRPQCPPECRQNWTRASDPLKHVDHCPVGNAEAQRGEQVTEHDGCQW